jgi:hypothetical protein
MVSAQEAKSTQKAAKNAGEAKLIARGKYIVEGVAGCGYCHTPRDEKGVPDHNKWLEGAPVFYQPAQRIQGWPNTAPRLAGLPPLERCRDDYAPDHRGMAKRPASPRSNASFSYDAHRRTGSRGLSPVA